jgi:hypothetical protein
MTRELGRPIEYVDIPVEAWGDALAGVTDMTDSLVTHLKAVALDYQDGIFRGESAAVERVGGQPPLSLEAFIRQVRPVFEANDAVAS